MLFLWFQISHKAGNEDFVVWVMRTTERFVPVKLACQQPR